MIRFEKDGWNKFNYCMSYALFICSCLLSIIHSISIDTAFVAINSIPTGMRVGKYSFPTATVATNRWTDDKAPTFVTSAIFSLDVNQDIPDLIKTHSRPVKRQRRKKNNQHKANLGTICRRRAIPLRRPKWNIKARKKRNKPSRIAAVPVVSTREEKVLNNEAGRTIPGRRWAPLRIVRFGRRGRLRYGERRRSDKGVSRLNVIISERLDDKENNLPNAKDQKQKKSAVIENKQKKSSREKNDTKKVFNDTIKKEANIISDIKPNKENEGERITFSSSYEARRTLRHEEKDFVGLLHEYMTQPVDSYSILSFHDHDANIKSRRRRWLIRNLTSDELRRNDSLQHPTLTDLDLDDRYFRLAVPLMPLLGLDLTPIIDLEVIPASGNDPTKGVECVRIKSMRLSLLSKEDEVKNAMEPQVGKRAKKSISQPTPTKVSQNQSIHLIGNEAIDLAAKIEEKIRPHLALEALITWNDSTLEGSVEGNNVEWTSDLKGKYSSISVKSTATASITIPSLPFVIPLPSSFLAKKIGSILLRRALKLALPNFLRQVERDFERWAQLGENSNQ